MEQRRLGRTGHRSSVAILGGAAFARATPEQTERSFELALRRGVNHVDIAPSYGDAEENLGPLLPDHRDDLFLGCKTQRRNPEGVRAQLEESLRRLRTDHVDLYQLHAVTSVEDLDERAGAVEAILAARDEGLTRFVGITGHDLGTARAQLAALERWDLDTVMFPLSPRLWSEERYRADVEALLAHCGAHDVGVQVIKAVSWRPWGERSPDADTWYEPRTDPAMIERGVAFALSTPGVHCIATPGERSLLAPVLDAADRAGSVSTSRRQAMVREAVDEPLIFPIAEHARS
jgi:predicted aldo/keto reductase-like oxidoreductase